MKKDRWSCLNNGKVLIEDMINPPFREIRNNYRIIIDSVGLVVFQTDDKRNRQLIIWFRQP